MEKQWYNYLDRYGYVVATENLSEQEISAFIRRNENLSNEASLDFATGRIDGPYSKQELAEKAAIKQDQETREKYSNR